MGRAHLVVVAATLALTACRATLEEEVDTSTIDTTEPVGPEVTSTPSSSDALLINQGTGVTNFHFGWWCNLPPITFTPEECVDRVRDHWPDGHPDSATAYFRWSWAELEPTRGELRTDLIDNTMQTAALLGEALGIRVVTIQEGGMGVPDWLTEEIGATGEWVDGTFWPDVRDPVYLAEHKRLLELIAERYDGHPALDHVDIGTVGCWGEWNTACLPSAADIHEVYSPTSSEERDEIEAAYAEIIDHHLEAFEETPLLMLGIGYEADSADSRLLVRATEGGAGWRFDCWGDWGLLSPTWNHHEDAYPWILAAAAANSPDFTDLWKRAPIHLEVCGTMPSWYDFGYRVEDPDSEVLKSFDWAIEQHASLFNAKWTDIPENYREALDDLLIGSGHRLAVESVTHPEYITAGSTLDLAMVWRNLGGSPAYHPRDVTIRLRSDEKIAIFNSSAEIRGWLPEAPSEHLEQLELPEELPPGDYAIEVALLARPGEAPETVALPATQLAMEGRLVDGFYPISTVEVR